MCVRAGDLHVPGVVSTGGGEFAGVLHMDLSVGRQDVVPLYGQWYVQLLTGRFLDLHPRPLCVP